jgi:AAA family ATP:ADP antiporter
MRKLFAPILDAKESERKNLVFVLISYFFVLFNYPLLRSTTDAIYLEAYGGKSSPVIWLFSVVALSGIIFLYNKVQNQIGVHSIFHWTTGFTILIFVSGLFFYNQGFKPMAGFLFIWKEAYIVILVHLIIGYCNAFLSYDEAKVFFGPLGAMGSIGGIVGGSIASVYAKKLGIDIVIYFGCLGLLLNALFFHLTERTEADRLQRESKEKPLESIKGIGKYVFSIALLVALSQFIVSIANLEFNKSVDLAFPLKEDKAAYMAQVYTLINVVTLVIQFLIMPPLFRFKGNHFSQIAIAVIYSLVTIAGLFFGSGSLMLLSATFLTLKAFDYSLFTASKELLYYPLKTSQKYGAKYVVDMVVYRFSKGLIAIVLIKFQDKYFLNSILALSMIMWFMTVAQIFKEAKKLEIQK